MNPWHKGLWPSQVTAAKRALELLRGDRGAILADPVGRGKTHIAAGVARAWLEAPDAWVVVVAPARLREHWERVLGPMPALLDIGDITTCPPEGGRSIQRVSQTVGAAPVMRTFWLTHAGVSRMNDGKPHALIGKSVLWILDEAHRFKEPRTQRTQTLSVLVSADHVLLVTATPVQMQMRDIQQLLCLFGGLPAPVSGSERETPRSTVLEALRRFACVQPPPEADAFEVQRVAIRVKLQTLEWKDVVSQLDGLSLEPVLGTSSYLFRALLYRRLGSHPACLVETARRLLRYLRTVRREGGSVLSKRSFYRRFGMDGPVQAQLFGASAEWTDPDWDEEGSLTFDACSLARLMEQVETLCREVERLGDTPWLEAVESYLDETLGEPGRGFGEIGKRQCVLFTRFRGSAKAYARGLSSRWRVGLVAGSCAWEVGIKTEPQSLLGSFDVAADEAARVQILVATDVISEGHNLQRASCLVHLDTPWNPARMTQREGRILRHGQANDRCHIGVVEPLGDGQFETSLDGLCRRVRTRRGLMAAASTAIWTPHSALSEQHCDGGQITGLGGGEWKASWSRLGKELFDLIFAFLREHRWHPATRKTLRTAREWAHVVDAHRSGGVLCILQQIHVDIAQEIGLGTLTLRGLADHLGRLSGVIPRPLLRKTLEISDS